MKTFLKVSDSYYVNVSKIIMMFVSKNVFDKFIIRIYLGDSFGDPNNYLTYWQEFETKNKAQKGLDVLIAEIQQD